MAAYSIRSTGPGGATVQGEDATVTGVMPFLSGRFAIFDTWAEVSNSREGRFLERMVPGAFKNTIARDRAAIKIIYDHGQDAYIGRKPLAPVELLGEDSVGVFYGGRLFDTGYCRDLVPALRAGQFGSSFQFETIAMDVEDFPKRSDYNPLRLPERTIREARVREIGPTPFPVYATTTAGARGSRKMEESDRAAFLRRIAGGREDTPEARESRKRWLDSIPAGRR